MSLGSQVHHVPQATLPHKGPVRSTIEVKSMPPSAAAEAAASHRSSLFQRKSTLQTATIPKAKNATQAAGT